MKLFTKQNYLKGITFSSTTNEVVQKNYGLLAICYDKIPGTEITIISQRKKSYLVKDFDLGCGTGEIRLSTLILDDVLQITTTNLAPLKLAFLYEATEDYNG